LNRRLRSLLTLNAALVAVGALVAAAWVYLSGGQLLAEMAQAPLAGCVALITITAAWVAVRFVRWQFLLRRAGVRLPLRGSLLIYLASLLGIITPAYIGELAIRAGLIRQQFGVPVMLTTPLVVFERLLDIIALVIILIATALQPEWWNSLASLMAVIALLALVSIALHAWTQTRSRWPRWAWRGQVFTQALAFSLIAWTAAALLIPVAAASAGVPVSIPTGMTIFGRATLLGGLTLAPAGIGVTGSAAIVELQGAGLNVRDAVVVTSLYRAMSTGLCLAVGAVFLLQYVTRRVRAPKQALHFDNIAAEYSAQWSPHMWEYLLERKLGFVIGALPGSDSARGLGLDLGCGLGLQCTEMNRRGLCVVGLDPALQLLRAERVGCPSKVAGQAGQLPFSDETFEFVYTIGVLHHLDGRAGQEAACREVARILKPNGVFVVHETNPRNPLFRFYMGYLFPLLRSIDEGIEWWIDPRRWEAAPGLKLVGLHYFTFLPDFVPASVFRPARAIELFLERSALHCYSAHYVAVLRKVDGVLA
jgi:uncharacterized membrane protein YbhN (UPF0104 family)/SAM-dependent methyltransferase